MKPVNASDKFLGDERESLLAVNFQTLARFDSFQEPTPFVISRCFRTLYGSLPVTVVHQIALGWIRRRTVSTVLLTHIDLRDRQWLLRPERIHNSAGGLCPKQLRYRISKHESNMMLHDTRGKNFD